ncbi:MAG: cation:proton antiporter [Bdellovibrionales bacterium]|nr:cation:proton antiporter [Bdellovibrionales bacterium]
MNTHGLLGRVVVYLSAAVVAVPVSAFLGLGSVIGYLAAGMAIGPHGLGLISSVEDVMHFAEFGVVLLLFLIGLELNPRKLWQLRGPILGTGGLQVALTTAILAVALRGTGLSWNMAWLASMGFSLSSTAIALQLLRERNLMPTPAGQTSFSVLLFQDLAVIPMLAVVPFLGSAEASAGGDAPWISALKSVGAILAVVVVGRFLVRPVFRVIARTRLREMFTAFSLFLVVAIAALMQAVGLSMALGAFLAGVLLADSEYRHELEVDIEPFKGLLLGLFFISVGMSVNFDVLLARPLEIAGAVGAAVLLKAAVLLGVGRWTGLKGRECVVFGLALSQVGEFAFVLFGLGGQLGVFDAGTQAFLVLTVALSMLTTPFLFMADQKWIAPRFNRKGPTGIVPGSAASEPVQTKDGAVIIAGYGRFGQVVGRILHSRGVPTVFLDHDPNQIDLLRKFGQPAYYGDVRRLDLLHSAGAERARLLVLSVDDMETVFETARLVREHFPKLPMVARARGRVDAYRLVNLGIPVVRETFHSGLRAAELVLKELGLGAYEARRLVARFGAHDESRMRAAAALADDEKALISLAHEGRMELEKLMKGDEEQGRAATDDGWG